MEGLNSGQLRTIQLLIRAGIECTRSGLLYSSALGHFASMVSLQCRLCHHFYWTKFSPSFQIGILMVYMITNSSQ